MMLIDSYLTGYVQKYTKCYISPMVKDLYHNNFVQMFLCAINMK